MRSKLSAFAVLYDRSSAPLDPGALDCIMQYLSHRGPDGENIMTVGSIAMGHWHFWTTPEEVGERQPLHLAGLPLTLVFDGRLDNREELFERLSISIRDGVLISDAGLIIYAYAAWGTRCVEYFVGEFAFVLWDEHQRTLFCARDQLGDRSLFYTYHKKRILIASEPWALAIAHNTQPELDESVVAHFFALRGKPGARTIFKNVWELLPGHTISFVGDTEPRQVCYWQPDLSRKIRYKSDKEYSDHFRVVLEESIRCRMRSTTPIGVMMSGGLDSTSIASLAAQVIAPQQLMTFSYVFDEFPECDERTYINAVKEKWGILSIQFLCDDAWPFKDLETLPVNPNYPTDDAFKWLIERTYGEANHRGVRVLLSGMFADHMFRGGVDWLADLLAEHRFSDALRQLFIHKILNVQTILQRGFLQRAMRQVVNAFPGGKYLHRHNSWPDWLTKDSIRYLLDQWEQKPVENDRHASMLNINLAQASSLEIYNAGCHEIDIRYPFRDRRLVELVLALPAYQLYYNAVNKHILRNAMQGILPDSVRCRLGKTHYQSLFFHGIERENNVLERYLKSNKAEWKKLVRNDWLQNQLQNRNGMNQIIAWLCISFEIWYDNFCSGGHHGDKRS